MLGVNLMFAGLALTMNGLSYYIDFDERIRGFINAFVGLIIGINALLQTIWTPDGITYAFAAASWLFALNYFVIAAHILLKSTNWKAFGLYGLFAAIVSFIFAAEAALTAAPLVLVYLWAMWGLLWTQACLAILFNHTKVDRFSSHILLINGVASTFVPGMLILLGVIL